MCYSRFGTSFRPIIKSKVAKKKRKLHTIICNEGTEGEQWYSTTLSVTWAIDGGGWSSSLPGRFTPGIGQCPLSSRLVASQGRSGRVRKPPLPRGFDPRTKVSKMFKQVTLELGTDTLYRNISNMPPIDSARHYLIKVPFSVTLFISSACIPNFRDGDYFWNNWRCNTVWDVLCYCVVYWTSSDDRRSELQGFYIVGCGWVEYGLGVLVEWYRRIKEILEGNPHPVSLCLPWISRELAWYRIRVSAIIFQRLFPCR